MQFQGGDEAQRIMNSEKIKSALINPVKKKKKKRKQTYRGQLILKSIPCLSAEGVERATKAKRLRSHDS